MSRKSEYCLKAGLPADVSAKALAQVEACVELREEAQVGWVQGDELS
jgi:hypothetical protein